MTVGSVVTPPPVMRPHLPAAATGTARQAFSQAPEMAARQTMLQLPEFLENWLKPVRAAMQKLEALPFLNSERKFLGGRFRMYHLLQAGHIDHWTNETIDFLNLSKAEQKTRLKDTKVAAELRQTFKPEIHGEPLDKAAQKSLLAEGNAAFKDLNPEHKTIKGWKGFVRKCNAVIDEQTALKAAGKSFDENALVTAENFLKRSPKDLFNRTSGAAEDALRHGIDRAPQAGGMLMNVFAKLPEGMQKMLRSALVLSEKVPGVKWLSGGFVKQNYLFDIVIGGFRAISESVKTFKKTDGGPFDKLKATAGIFTKSIGTTAAIVGATVLGAALLPELLLGAATASTVCVVMEMIGGAIGAKMARSIISKFTTIPGEEDSKKPGEAGAPNKKGADPQDLLTPAGFQALDNQVNGAPADTTTAAPVLPELATPTRTAAEPALVAASPRFQGKTDLEDFKYQVKAARQAGYRIPTEKNPFQS